MEAEGMASPSRNEYLLRVLVRQGESRGRLQLFYPVPAVPEGDVRLGENDTALGVRIVHAQVVILSGGGIVGGVPDLHLDIFDGIMSDLVFLDDLNKRLLVVLKADRLFIAGVQADGLDPFRFRF